MLLFVLLLQNFIGLVFSAEDVKCECGIPNNETQYVDGRIVNGNIAEPNIFPWLALILKDNHIHCGGSLINNRYVLTAGHCVIWMDLSTLKVALGVHDVKEVTTLLSIADVNIHEDFTSLFNHDTHDIALLRLEKKVQFSKNISPICLPHRLSLHAGRIAHIAGWGRTSENGEVSELLRHARVTVMDDNFCLSSPISEHYIGTMMCAYEDDIDACQGDSGAPLMHEMPSSKFEIIGVVSWGIGCATPKHPGVYTKVVEYVKWIKRNTRDASYCTH